MQDRSNFIKKHKIISVVKSENYKNSYKFAESCIEGGIKIIEVIITAQGAKNLIKDFANVKDIKLGAGTVLDINSAKESIDLGAQFVVSPHTDPEIINYCKERKITVISGAFTSSEIIRTWKLGADFVKIFPVSTVGNKYIKAIKDPLPFVDIFVTGGINHNNFVDYLSSGASAVGVSTALLLDTDGRVDYSAVRKNAEKFSNMIKKIEEI